MGYWEVAGKGGGVARSTDGGVHFTLLSGIEGESVRALAAAPGRPQVLVAGALSGVFRSTDGGETWRRVSPEGHDDLRNVESVAIDPTDPDVFYAGSWHLAWKTENGGRSWRLIASGMIGDSDVMTLSLDRRNREVVYATACSGIYRSAKPRRGEPRSRDSVLSRRTRARPGPEQTNLLRRDHGGAVGQRGRHGQLAPGHGQQAGGERGAGSAWWPPAAGHGRRGVLASADRGRTWTESNQGFSSASSPVSCPIRGPGCWPPCGAIA